MNRIYSSILVTVVFVISVQAQNFNYSLGYQQASYTALPSPVSITQGNDWHNRNYSIPIGFRFDFLGAGFDSVSIRTNGFFVFDDKPNFAIVSFNELVPKKEASTGIYSSINYKLEGTTGNRILKIEYNNCGFHTDLPGHFFNYQVWLYEAGNKIEFHIGANTYSAVENEFSPLLGLINMNQDTNDKAFLIGGNPSSPEGVLINGAADLIYLNSVPAEGTVYILQPSSK